MEFLRIILTDLRGFLDVRNARGCGGFIKMKLREKKRLRSGFDAETEAMLTKAGKIIRGVKK